MQTRTASTRITFRTRPYWGPKAGLNTAAGNVCWPGNYDWHYQQASEQFTGLKGGVGVSRAQYVALIDTLQRIERRLARLESDSQRSGSRKVEEIESAVLQFAGRLQELRSEFDTLVMGIVG